MEILPVHVLLIKNVPTLNVTKYFYSLYRFRTNFYVNYEVALKFLFVYTKFAYYDRTDDFRLKNSSAFR